MAFFPTTPREASAYTHRIQQAIARCDGINSSFRLIRKVLVLTHNAKCTNEQLQRSEAAVAYAIVNEEPEPPTGLRTGVPIELDRVISSDLQKHVCL